MAALTAVPAKDNGEFYNLIQLERNEEGDVHVTWHPNLATDRDAMYQALQMVISAAAKLFEETERVQ